MRLTNNGSCGRQRRPISNGVNRFYLPVFCLLSIFLITPFLFGSVNEQKNVIVVIGEGETETVPDTANVNLGITVFDKKAQECYKKNNRNMKQVVENLKTLGLEEGDIKTIRYSLNPEYEHRPRKLKGYRLSHILSLKVQDLEKLGKILDSIVEKGVNEINGVNFTASEIDKLKDRAREEAIRNAKDKAEKIAKAAGVKLDKVIKIEEVTPGFRPVGAVTMESRGGGPPIQPGMFKVKIFLKVTFSIR